MKIVVSVICAALLVILAVGAALWLLAGDLFGAGAYTLLAVLDGIVLWLATDVNRKGIR